MLSAVHFEILIYTPYTLGTFALFRVSFRNVGIFAMMSSFNLLISVAILPGLVESVL